MIVKVQLSLAGSGPFRTGLIYNQTRSILHEVNGKDEVAYLERRLGKGVPKAYFYAVHQEDGRLDLRHTVEEQSW